MTDSERVIATVESVCGPVPTNLGTCRGVPIETLDRPALLAAIHMMNHQHKQELERECGSAEMFGIFKAIGLPTPKRPRTGELTR